MDCSNDINNAYYYSSTETTKDLELKIKALEKEPEGLQGKNCQSAKIL